jgi:hypothetical protein
MIGAAVWLMPLITIWVAVSFIGTLTSVVGWVRTVIGEAAPGIEEPSQVITATITPELTIAFITVAVLGTPMADITVVSTVADTEVIAKWHQKLKY